MKPQKSANNHIWILLATGFALRLAVHFGVSAGTTGAFHAWAMVCDVAVGYMIYWLIQKSDFVTAASKEGRRPLFLAALWLFNPAVIFVSSVLGLMEPLFALLMVLILLQIRDKLYGAALILVLPVVFQVRHWMAYDYSTASAFNFFAFVGGINRDVYVTFLGFSHSVWGVVFALVIVSGAALALYVDYQAGGQNYFLIIGAYFILLFVFSTGMQERSLFPGLVFLLIHYIEKRDARVLGLYLAFSVTFFINCNQMLRLSQDAHHIWAMADSVIFASAANVLIALVLTWVLVNAVWPGFKWLAPPGEARQGIPVKYYIWILLAAGFVVRALVAMYMNAPDDWLLTEQAVRLFERGLPRFYGSMYQTIADYSYWTGVTYTFTISQTNYPPGFYYMLYVIGALRYIFGWGMHGAAFRFAVFVPAILCDLAIGYVLYRRGVKSQEQDGWGASCRGGILPPETDDTKQHGRQDAAPTRHTGTRLPVLLAAFWILSPAVILISGAWGPAEPVFVLMLLLSLLLLRDMKLLPAYLLFGIAVLIRPQALFLAPVYVYWAYRYLQEKEFSAAGILRLAAYVGAVLAAMVLLTLPFNLSAAAGYIWDGAMSRPYGSYNAFNFFALVGGSMRPLNTRFMGMTYGLISFIAIIAIIIFAVTAMDKNRKQGHYFLIVGGLFALLFVFAFRMQVVYLFPALPFLLLHAIESRDRRVLGLYVGFSATFFFNCLEVLHMAGRHGVVREDVLRVVSLGNVLLAGVLLFVLVGGVWVKGDAPVEIAGEQTAVDSEQAAADDTEQI